MSVRLSKSDLISHIDMLEALLKEKQLEIDEVDIRCAELEDRLSAKINRSNELVIKLATLQGALEVVHSCITQLENETEDLNVLFSLSSLIIMIEGVDNNTE